MKKLLVFHPFLFAVFPVLFLFSHNIGEVLFSQALVPTAVVLIFTFVLFLLFRLILKDNKKAAILVSFLLILFFSYFHIYMLINKFIYCRHRYLLPILCIIICFCSYFIIRTRKNLYAITNILNLVAFCLVMISLINIAAYELKTYDTFRHKEIMKRQELNITDSQKTKCLPDIYYIILDGYSSSRTLEEIYSYDNSEFINYLTDKGFYIASKSYCNYAGSFFSLASSLNMEYINYLSNIVRAERDFRIPFHMIRDNKVMRFLKQRGYKFVHFGTWWGPTNRNQYADLDFYRYRCLDDFMLKLMEITMFNVFFDYFLTHISRCIILYTFDKLAEIPDIKVPTFVFAHIIAPHYPYVFGPNGEEIKIQYIQNNQYHLGQLIFINKKVKELIESILLNSEHSPIIILQADHGWVFSEDSEKSIRERGRIFNAYYLPGDDKRLLYESITPVNSFRLIFNLYFNTNFKLLPDESYAFLNENHPYKFFNVTDRVK